MHLYVLTNAINGKRYVGQTIGSLTRRFACHKRSTAPIGCAIRKYGWENFTVHTIRADSLENLNALEELAIRVLESRYTHHGYNIKFGGNNQRGQPISDETRAKKSAALKGRKRPPEVVAKIAAANRGRKKSPEQIEKHRQKLLGRKLTAEHRAKISAGNKGRVFTEETRRKISVAQTGKKRSPEAIENIRRSQIGKKHSAETRAKMSAARKGIKLGPRNRSVA